MTQVPIHPGEHLAEELRELSMSAAELARKLGVPTNRVTSILNGRRAITGDTALRLAHFFGTSAEFWLNLQSLYETASRAEESGGVNQEFAHTRAREAVHEIRTECSKAEASLKSPQMTD